MHNHNDKYQARPGFEPGTSRLQAPIYANKLPGPACLYGRLPWSLLHLKPICYFPRLFMLGSVHQIHQVFFSDMQSYLTK